MTCFWTDIVFATQECPAEDDDVFYLLIPDGVQSEYDTTSHKVQVQLGGNCGYPMNLLPGKPTTIAPAASVLPSTLTLVSAVLYAEQMLGAWTSDSPVVTGSAHSYSYAGFVYRQPDDGAWDNPTPRSTAGVVSSIDDSSNALTLDFTVDLEIAEVGYDPGNPGNNWVGVCVIAEFSHALGTVYARIHDGVYV